MLWKPTCHYRIHKTLSRVPIMNQFNPILATSHFLMSHSNIILSSTPEPSNRTVSLRFPPKPSMELFLFSTSHMPHPPSFLSFGNHNTMWWTAQITKHLTNRHLPMVLPVCPLRHTTCTYNVHCATGSTLPLAMSTQSVDRAADGTEVCRSVVSVICKGINWFDSSSDIGAIYRRLICWYCTDCAYWFH